MRDAVDAPRVMLVGLVLAVAAAFVVGGTVTGVAFDPFNPDWDGTSDLRSAAEAAGADPVVVGDASRYDEYGDGDVAVVVAPTDGYADADAARVRAFVERGGTLVVADRDGPHGHALLEAVGATARPDGAILRDDRHHHGSPALPVATEVGSHPLVADTGVDSVTLNYGTAVEPNGATVLVASSPYAYLDRDGSGTISEDEVADSYPVATVEEVGDGHVVVIGDPSVFINAMQADPDNRPFVAALLGDADHALVDVSHGSAPPPLVAALLTIRGSALLQAGLGVGALVVVAATGRSLERRRASGMGVESGEGEDVDGDADTTVLDRLTTSVDEIFRERLTEGVISVRYKRGDDE